MYVCIYIYTHLKCLCRFFWVLEGSRNSYTYIICIGMPMGICSPVLQARTSAASPQHCLFFGVKSPGCHEPTKHQNGSTSGTWDGSKLHGDRQPVSLGLL